MPHANYCIERCFESDSSNIVFGVDTATGQDIVIKQHASPKAYLREVNALHILGRRNVANVPDVLGYVQNQRGNNALVMPCYKESLQTIGK